MKNYYLLLFLVLMSFQQNVFAEDINVPGLAVPKLIITEVRPDAAATAYLEITNMGDTAINLESFTIHSVHFNTRCTEYSDSAISFNRRNAAVDGTIGKIYLKGILQPGESYVVSNVWDANDARGSGIPTHNTALAQIGNQFAHIDESLNLNGWINKPEWQCYGRDSVSARSFVQLRAEATAGYLIHWVYQKEDGTTDSTYIDQFNHFWYPDENEAAGINYNMKGYRVDPIAGVDDAMTEYIMLRKPNVTEGNLNWNQSRGTDASTSEWVVIPKNTSKQLAFTTVGSHGEYDLSYAAKDPSTIIVNEGAGTISVPWQIVRGDSLARYFNLGEGMGWSYDLVGVFEDSASYIARPGDKFAFHAAGAVVDSKEYTIEVREPEEDLAVVFPRRRLIIDEEIVEDEVSGTVDTITTRYWSGGFVFGLAVGPEIDSIINVPFATRTDSLLKYLDKPEKAAWEFVFVDGQDRVDLQFGDKLKVTSENGTVIKEYFVAVDEAVLSNNALLSAVTWPDIDKNMYPRWITGDTLPEFTPLKTAYTVELRPDATKIPAFQFKTQDLRATYEVVNAKDLDGNMEQRTTTVTVTAESDTISVTYSFVFQKQGVPVQPNIAEPFISEMVWNTQTQGCAFEIYNPGTEDLDLSRYMYVAGSTSQTWQEAVETCVTNRYWAGNPNDGIMIYQTHYVPSKRWRNDGSEAEWMASPTVENPYAGPGFLRDDNQTDPWVKGGDVFVAGVGTSNTASGQVKIRQESDFIFRGATVDETVFAWDSTKILHRETPIWNDPRHNMWLLKILNDSIIDGTKDVRDHTAYELIDRIEVIGDTIAGRLAKGKDWSLIRKSTVTKGNLERMGGASSTPENSEWILRKRSDPGVGNDGMVANVGLHTMDPVTNYLSSVTSLYFVVTTGYSGDNLSITGSVADYTPQTIAPLLDKADATQVFVFKRGETVLADDASLADGDVLEVTSGDGKNTTVYALINSPLDGNTSLTAKDGSGLSVANNKVSGVTIGMSLKEIVANLEVAEKSVMYLKNASGALQPMTVHNLDSLLYDVLVSDQIYIEVVAENSDSEMYTFDMGLVDNSAVLFSDILAIDQERKLVMEFPDLITAQSLLSMVYTNEGASAKVLDKAGFERSIGFLNIDDVVEVTAPDGVTTVNYTFAINYTEPVVTAGITFVVDDSQGKTYTGFDLKGSWNSEGEYDNTWSDGALQASFVDDGTNGDATADDHIWSVTVTLISDGGTNTWEWGFQDDAGNWVPGENQQFTIADGTAQTLTYAIVGVDNNIFRNVSIYPNPARSVVTVANAEGAMISILDLNGRTLKIQENAAAECELDIAGLSGGIYLIEIQLDNKLNVSKLVVE